MIAIASDHGGYLLKEELKKLFDKNNYQYKDFGTNSTDSTDYPDYALVVAEAVARGEFEKGILICNTGIGISIAANKVPGIRAALCNDPLSARLTREHNDTNVLALGARIIGVSLAEEIVKVWLSTEFLGGRHCMRVEKINKIEEKYLRGV